VPELPRFSLRALLIVVVVVSLICAAGTLLGNRIPKHRASEEQRTKTILTALSTTATEAEAIRAKLGRAPADVKELEQLMGHSIPEFLGRSVEYRRTSANSYELIFFVEWLPGFNEDWLVYDSSRPAAGWMSICD
jgi:hypothetical protein